MKRLDSPRLWSSEPDSLVDSKNWGRSSRQVRQRRTFRDHVPQIQALTGPYFNMSYFFILLYSVTRLMPRSLAVRVRLKLFLNRACSMISFSVSET